MLIHIKVQVLYRLDATMKRMRLKIKIWNATGRA
jgi:hypothetical protein